jgi:hypothetical protein
MLIEALKSRSIDKLQNGQLCVRSDISFSTNFPHLEHILDILNGLTSITFLPAFSAL